MSQHLSDKLLDQTIADLPRRERKVLAELVALYPPLTEREVLALYTTAIGFHDRMADPQHLIVVLLDVVVEIIAAHKGPVVH